MKKLMIPLLALTVLVLAALACGDITVYDDAPPAPQQKPRTGGMTTWAEDPIGNAQRAEGNILLSVVAAGFSVLAALRQLVSKRDPWTTRSLVWLVILIGINALSIWGANLAWGIGPTIDGEFYAGVGLFAGLFGLVTAWAREAAVDVFEWMITSPFKWFFGR